MEIEREELEHLKQLIKDIQTALLNRDAVKLRELSNQTTHSSCIFQHRGLITIAVLAYALGKIIERGQDKEIKNFEVFTKKFNSTLSEASSAIESENLGNYDSKIEKARKLLETISPNLKPYIEEVMKGASMNKGSKIYEHGISLEKTAQLLGVSRWELSPYIARSKIHEEKQGRGMTTKNRAKMALDFFS
jgi:archaellum component FlaC